MTSDEFDRILAAIVEMRALNINGDVMVSINGVLRIIHSNLHHDDKAFYKLRPELYGVEKLASP